MHLRKQLLIFIVLLCSFRSLISHNDGDCDTTPPPTEQPIPTPVPYRIVDVDKSLCHQLLMQAPSSVKKVIYNLIYPPKNVRAMPKKLLLVGPPGCGKSSIAQTIAYATGRHAVLMEAPFIANEYKNSGPQNLLRLLNEIVKIKLNCVIILDEINVLFKSNQGHVNPDAGLLEALWLFLDECAKHTNIFFVATCNDLKNIPPALKSRFEGEIVTIDVPNYDARQLIIHYFLSQTEHSLSQRYINWLVNKTKRLSIRDIEHMLMQATQNANFAHEDHILTEKDINQALKGIKTWNLRDYFENHKSLLEKFALHGIPIAISLVSLLVSLNSSGKQLAFQEEGLLLQKSSQLFQEKLAEENKKLQQQSAQLQRKGIELQEESMKKQEAATKRQEENTQKQMQLQKEAQEFQEKVAAENKVLQELALRIQTLSVEKQFGVR
ncbi:MAG: AAA family ATPase [Candidatus Dependentiae bacterium]